MINVIGKIKARIGWNVIVLSRRCIKMLNSVVREVLKENVVLEKRFERWKRESYVDV